MASWTTWFEHSHFFNSVQAILLIVIGYLLARLLARSTKKIFAKRLSVHQGMLMRRFIFYLIFSLFIASAIQHLGFHIGTLLGAAGILTAAIGFASQTSMSNVISGIFIIGEKPFEIGDVVKVNDIQGEVASIDLLSVKIRTSENTMVRVPNETLIKTAIVNLSYFPTRRFDMNIVIAYAENVERLRKMLLTVAEKNILCLADPAPTVKIQNFSAAGIEIYFSVWGNRQDFGELKNTIQEDVQIVLNEHGIETALSGRMLYMGHQSAPFSVKIIE